MATIGDILQELPQGGASFNLSDQQISLGSGAANIDLRYFGSGRVLVLVNGRRWIKGMNGSVDLSAIPASVIDHIEILEDGASAIYGSDAITGVINIITVNNFNGAEAHAYTGMYDNNYGGVKGWDGKTQEYDFTIGTSGPRSGVVASLSYTDTDPIWAADRAQTSQPVWQSGYGLFPVTKSFPGEVILYSPLLAGKQFGNASCSASGSCDMMLLDTPSTAPSLANFTDYQSTINSDVRGATSAARETTNIFLKGHYDIANNVTFTSMAAYSQVHGQQWPPGINAIGYGQGSWYGAPNGINIGVGKNNPYNPFGVDLVGNSSQFCPTGTTAGGATCDPNYLLPYLFTSLRPLIRHYDSRVSTTTVRMGLNGFFDALGSEWDWDAGYSFGQIIDDEDGQNIFDDMRVGQALDAPGFVQCNGPAQSSPGTTGTWQQINGKYYQILTPGCVPMNIFGGFNGATGQGSLTPAMLDYTVMTELWQNRVHQRDYTADITGTLANLPAGPLAIAVGADYLEEDGVVQPGPELANGSAADDAFQYTQGRTWTHAEYVELNIPLLSNVPFAHDLSVDIANRWSQFSWLGGVQGTRLAGEKQSASSTDGRAQIRWLPTSSLLLRASWAQGFRAPSISNLYAGAGFVFSPLQDPCAPASQSGGWDPTTPLPAGCDGNVRNQHLGVIQTSTGGNPGLRPETALSRSVGFVYSPSWLQGFNFSADYYKIEVDNTVGTAGGQFILDQCYLKQDPQYCSKVTVSGNAITFVNNTQENVGAEYSNGIDVSAGYALPSTPIGDFRINASWTFLRSFVSVVPASSSATGFVSIQNQGFSGFPTSKGNVSLNWLLGNWSANWNIQYIGQQYASCNALQISLDRCTEPDAIYEPTEAVGKNHIGTTIYNDASLTYHFAPVNADFTFGVRNLFNKQYPVSINGDFGLGYRIPGRFVYGRVGVKF